MFTVLTQVLACFSPFVLADITNQSSHSSSLSWDETLSIHSELDFKKRWKKFPIPAQNMLPCTDCFKESKWLTFKSFSLSEILNLQPTFNRTKEGKIDFTNEIKSYKVQWQILLWKKIYYMLSKIADYFKHIWSKVIGSIVSQVIVEWEALLRNKKISRSFGDNWS